ncbi:MAG: hypothetical protein WBF69_08980 [Castellaniella sp.]|uniref:hypothetical protein n=1 Tax=Castellaniella sp. TaxID=1955812 RepID=UPI003C786C1E
MPDIPDDPIAQLLADHANTRHQLAALTDPSRRAEAIAWFDGPAPARRSMMQQVLFPALIEAMAGSDAVCLKGMTQGLSDLGQALDRRWRAIRHLDDPAALRAWADDYRTYLDQADEELLPMSSRLLDDSALEQLRQALK